MIFATDRGVPYRSKPITYSTGDTVPVDLSFLHSPASRMKAPVIREVFLHWKGSISGVTATFDNKDGCMLFNKVQMHDRGGMFYDLPGKLIRQEMQIEYGERANEADTIADTASGATSTSQNMILRIPFDLELAAVGADTALETLRLVDGGGMSLTFGTPTGSTGATGTVYVYALIHDEKEREAKARLVRRAVAITAQEDSYPLDGSVRTLVATSNPNAAGYSAYTAATYASVNVPELELSAFDPHILRSEYKRKRMDYAADDVILASTPASIPFVTSSKGQRVDKMPDLRSVRIDIGGAAPTSAQLLISQIVDREPTLAAQWLGYSDVAGYLSALKSKGHVKLGKGSERITAFPPGLAKRLPVVIR